MPRTSDSHTPLKLGAAGADYENVGELAVYLTWFDLSVAVAGLATVACIRLRRAAPRRRRHIVGALRRH